MVDSESKAAGERKRPRDRQVFAKWANLKVFSLFDAVAKAHDHLPQLAVCRFARL